MTRQRLLVVSIALLAGLVLFAGCAQEEDVAIEPEAEVLMTFPVDGSRAAADTLHPVVFDPDVSSDGNGSFRVTTEEPVNVTLFELGDIDIEGQQLTYKALVRTEDLEGQAYIEMVCAFGDQAYFSRALDSQIHGSVDWTEQETPFYLQETENPTNVKLNLVVYGSGTAWIDEVTVSKQPLPPGQVQQ